MVQRVGARLQCERSRFGHGCCVCPVLVSLFLLIAVWKRRGLWKKNSLTDNFWNKSFVAKSNKKVICNFFFSVRISFIYNLFIFKFVQKVRAALTKKTSGYRPYLYDNTFDGCKFMRERKNPVLNFAYGFVERHSNMNHTCPYDVSTA